MTNLDQVLRDFAALFERMDIPYAVMGGLAVRVYAIPRPTHDADFTIAIDRVRLPELYSEVRNLGYSVPESFDSGWVDTVAGMPLIRFRLYLEQHGIDVDVFLAESEFQRQIIARRQRVDLDEHSFMLVSPEDLVLLKLLAGRPRDLIDVQDILFTQGSLDEAYMRQWSKELRLSQQLENALRQPRL
jgi:hypothetical protein